MYENILIALIAAVSFAIGATTVYWRDYAAIREAQLGELRAKNSEDRAENRAGKFLSERCEAVKKYNELYSRLQKLVGVESEDNDD